MAAEEMIASDAHRVLRRKAKVGRSGYEARIMTPARAVRLALARAAEKLFDLPLVVTGVQVSRVTQDMVLEQINDGWLITVLDGPDGAMGVSAVDMPVLGALVESQTLGRVSSRSSEARSPTQTDAALFAPLIDQALSVMSDELAKQGGDIRIAGFRFGARMESARMLGLLLEAQEFHFFRLDIVLGDGAKQGEMVLALPVAARSAIKESGGGKARPDTDHADGEQCAKLVRQGVLMEAEVRLDAVLWKHEMPLSAIEALAVDDVLEIPEAALSRTQLHAGSERLPGSFQLGQKNGFRAVRLNMTETGGENPSRSTGTQRQDLVTSHDAEPALSADIAAQGTPVVNFPDAQATSPQVSERDGVRPLEQSRASLEIEDHLSDLPDLSDLPELS